MNSRGRAEARRTSIVDPLLLPFGKREVPLSPGLRSRSSDRPDWPVSSRCQPAPWPTGSFLTCLQIYHNIIVVVIILVIIEE